MTKPKASGKAEAKPTAPPDDHPNYGQATEPPWQALPTEVAYSDLADGGWPEPPEVAPS